jgi:hypothetical protein
LSVAAFGWAGVIYRDPVRARSTDPREDRWRGEPIAYRVDFWKPLGNLNPRRLSIGVPFQSDEWMLTDVRDVSEAIEWADAHADGRTYTLYAVYESGAERGLIHLLGVNPTYGHLGQKHEEEVARLFSAHGYSGEVRMVPVVAVDERVFVLAPHELAALTAPEELVASLEEYLAAPVRLVASPSDPEGEESG